ncbi:MAG: hypothetical protein FD181_998 [Prolixibacteraceae bacterium]|nr:MAG: hypothetical protein FD181_998 [Prolixibacteraceae bacterium]
MKLKDIVMTQDELKLHNYNDFMQTSEIPDESIEIDSSGRIISNKTSLLKFIDFLVTQFEYCPENKSTEEFEDEGEKKKNTEKAVPYSKLSLKKRKRIIQNMKHYPIDSSYYTKYGSTFGDYL